MRLPRSRSDEGPRPAPKRLRMAQLVRRQTAQRSGLRMTAARNGPAGCGVAASVSLPPGTCRDLVASARGVRQFAAGKQVAGAETANARASMNRIQLLLLTGGVVVATAMSAQGAENQPPATGHPRLYFTADDLPRLRALRAAGLHAYIWRNMISSAQWCMTQSPCTEWIAPVVPDPDDLNRYDRLYAAMHDAAIVEHLAFAYAYTGESQYFDAARAWATTVASVWIHEADNPPDAGRAAAAPPILKALAVSYDILHERVSEVSRDDIRLAMVTIGRSYYQWYVDHPTTGGAGQDRCQESVAAASLGVAALALLGEEPQAAAWLELMVKQHTDHLLPHVLLPSGAPEQGSQAWMPALQCRLMFLDALRRVTGRDLLREFPQAIDARVALAVIAGPGRRGLGEVNQSILFGPSDGQLNYWSPALLLLARERRQSSLQRLVLWDPALGEVQRTRYVTPNIHQLIFALGGYAYAWCDPTVGTALEPGLPLAFSFADVNEAYARASYEAGALVVGVRHGRVAVHAGGQPVLVDPCDPFQAPPPTSGLAVSEAGPATTIRCRGSAAAGYEEQSLELQRPGVLTMERLTKTAQTWWCAGLPTRNDNTLAWPSQTTLRVLRGTLGMLAPDAYTEEAAVSMGKLKCLDPTPMHYPTFTVTPDAGGRISVRIEQKSSAPAPS